MRSIPIILFAITALIPGAAAADKSDRISVLEERIDSLRCEASYAEALEYAVELLELLEGDDASSGYEIHDAERLVETLDMISGRPLSDQQEFARADRMTGQYFALYEDGLVDSAAALAGSQVALRKSLFGVYHIDIASSLSNFAYLLQETGEKKRSVELFREAVAIEANALSADHPDRGTDIMNLAGVLHDLTMYNEAESRYREALLIFMEGEGPESEDAAWAMESLGSLLKDVGEYETAELMMSEALGIYRALYGDLDYDVGRTLSNLGVLHQIMGEYLDAEPMFLEALKIYREILDQGDQDIGLVLVNLASLNQDLKNFGKARSYYGEALDIFYGSDASEYLESVTFNNMADMYHEVGMYDVADTLYEKALGISRSREGANGVEIAKLALNTARNCRDMRDYERAEPLYRESEDLFRSCLSGSNPLIAMHQFSWSNYHTARERYGEAERILLDAIPVFEAARSRLTPGLSRATFQNSPYPMLSNAYLRQGKTTMAWPCTEKYFGRALADMLIISDRDRLTYAERRTDDSLRSAVGELESVLAAIRLDGTSGPGSRQDGEVREIRLELLAAESDWNRFQIEVAAKYGLAETESYSLKRVQKALSGTEAIIGWLDIEERKGEFSSWIYVVRSKGPVVWKRAGRPGDSDSRSPRERMWVFRSALLQSGAPLSAVAREAAAIWDQRIKPVESELAGVTGLIVIPSGAMLGIPVETLVDDSGQALVDRFSISYTPSSTIYAWLREVSTDELEGPGELNLLIGDPPFNDKHLREMKGSGIPVEDSGMQDDTERSLAGGSITRAAVSNLRRLPGTRDEIMAISSIAPDAYILLGPDASEMNVHRLAVESDSLKRCSIIHIASHALIDDRAPERSCLVLSQCNLPDQLEYAARGERVFDGLVSTLEIINEWRLQADMVTLSACETALGKDIGGEGYIGFTNALLQAGARSVVVSLWKVEDEATSLLMRRFYENIFGRPEPMKKSEALMEAKTWLRDYTKESGERPYRHPYYWSSFILIGNRDVR